MKAKTKNALNKALFLSCVLIVLLVGSAAYKEAITPSTDPEHGLWSPQYDHAYAE